MIETSIIVIDLNGEKYIKKLLTTLIAECDSSTEVIIVFNGEIADLQSFKENKNIRSVVNKQNLGFAEACNQGTKLAKGKYFVFLNNDTIVEKGWLSNLRNTIKSVTRAGAVTSKILFYPKYTECRIETEVFTPNSVGSSDDCRSLGIRLCFENKWYSSTGPLKICGFHGVENLHNEEWRWSEKKCRVWIPTNCKNLILRIQGPKEMIGSRVNIRVGVKEICVINNGKEETHELKLDEKDVFDVVNSAGCILDSDGVCEERGIYEIDENRYKTGNVTSFSGCSVMVSKKAFNEVGGFDASFFAYYEDTDLSWRIRKAGWKIVYEPKSVVRHHHSRTSRQQSPFFCFHVYRNFRWNVAKNARWGIAFTLLLREIFSFVPKEIATDREYSAWRLKKETILGMLVYLSKRAAGIAR